jgi:hypothetical protein
VANRQGRRTWLAITQTRVFSRPSRRTRRTCRSLRQVARPVAPAESGRRIVHRCRSSQLKNVPAPDRDHRAASWPRPGVPSDAHAHRQVSILRHRVHRPRLHREGLHQVAALLSPVSRPDEPPPIGATPGVVESLGSLFLTENSNLAQAPCLIRPTYPQPSDQGGPPARINMSRRRGRPSVGRHRHRAGRAPEFTAFACRSEGRPD